MLETTDIRTTSSYTTCRACKKTVAPQMMRVIFMRESDEDRWRVAAWECLCCHALCLSCKYQSCIGCDDRNVCFNKESSRYRESIGTRKACALYERITWVTLPYIGD